MPVTTLSPANTFTTPHYKRTLPTLNGNLVPAGTPGAKGVQTFAMLIGTSGKDGFKQVDVANQEFYSNNANSGVSFVGFNRAKSITNVTLDVGPNPSGQQDFGDSVFFDNEKAPIVVINNSTFITGTEGTVPTGGDKDLVVFSSDKFDDKSGPFLGIAGLSVASKGEMDIYNSTVQTGRDNDTVIFASTNTASIIQGTTVNVGTGADYVYFNRTQSISTGNTIDVGNDAAADTIRFASTSLNQQLTIKNFKAGDVIQVGVAGTGTGGVTASYTTQAAANAAFGGKITFI